MQIYGPTHLHGPQAIRGPHVATEPEPKSASPSVPASDEVEISTAARLIDAVHALPEVRSDRVSAIREEIAAGTYDTDEKLDIALNRLLDEIG